MASVMVCVEPRMAIISCIKSTRTSIGSSEPISSCALTVVLRELTQKKMKNIDFFRRDRFIIMLGLFDMERRIRYYCNHTLVPAIRLIKQSFVVSDRLLLKLISTQTKNQALNYCLDITYQRYDTPECATRH